MQVIESRFESWFFPSHRINVFGDPKVCRLETPDALNTYMFNTMFQEYVKWQEENHTFYSGYNKDKSMLNVSWYLKFVYALGGFSFAGMVINPNYTRPSSFYLRKFNVLFCLYLGYTFGIANYHKQEKLILLRMNDYFPMEVKRALATQDYRYFALFDYKNADRKLFDDKTGKSLS